MAGKNKRIPPESLKPFSCPHAIQSATFQRVQVANLHSLSSPPELAKTCHLRIYTLLDCCQPPPLYCNRKRFCSHQPLGFPSRWPRLLTMLLHWLFRRDYSGYMRLSLSLSFMVVPGKPCIVFLWMKTHHWSRNALSGNIVSKRLELVSQDLQIIISRNVFSWWLSPASSCSFVGTYGSNEVNLFSAETKLFIILIWIDKYYLYCYFGQVINL